MRLAVIDLGTNTCNLLVAETKNAGFTILHQSKQLVRLGDNKIRNNEISPEATIRVLDSFRRLGEIIQLFNVDKVKVLATSAVRSAENKITFLETLSENAGWIIKVISGEMEAELIFKGVLLAFNELTEPSVILDIGGGSNELILAHHNSMVWKESQPTGMARVINRFSLSDPIQKAEIHQLQQFFLESHENMYIKCRGENVKTLIGCSGAFDTIADIIDKVDPGEKQRKTQIIHPEEFNNVYQLLIQSTREERLNMKGMDFVRVDLIVPGVILIKQLISEIGIEQIFQTDFALREGVLFETMDIDFNTKSKF
jgi:exopolyphosphatase / guanosine-5'-triphosphate,3'-diphosphate pyrophosphatase